jgi:exopolysaccharide biosynthesis polyprenyl glycosylphosphotransferase
MYHGKIERFDWRFALRVLDVLGVIAALAISLPLWNLIAPRWGAWHFVPIDNATWLSCVFYGFAELFAFKKAGLYAWSCLLRPGTLAVRLAVALALAGATVGIIRAFVAPTAPFFAALWFLANLGVTFCTVFLLRLGLRVAYPRMLAGDAVERIAFIGWSVRLETVLKALVQEMGRYQEVAGCIYEGSNPQLDPQAGHGHRLLGTLERLDEILPAQRISLLLVDQSNVSPRDMRRIADIAADRFVTLRMIPSAFDIWASRLSLRIVAGIPLMGINDLHHDRFGNRLLKRAFDIVCALGGLVVSAPVIAVLAILIRRESPGPIFYRQTRLGLNGRPFQIIKLRSMPTDAENSTGAVWAVKDDPRRLKIGRFMRATNLDELPQLWNVLKGDMSMVGPRPERPEFVEGFRDTIRYYNLRHTCKPGLTGWAAVHGLRGNTSIEDRIEYDLFYVENWSLLMDLKIVLMTLAPPKNAH